MTVMVKGAEEKGKRGQERRYQNVLFYADNGIVASLDPQWIQGEFSTLVGLVDRVGLRTNVGRTVGIVCCLYQAAGTRSEAAYKRRMAGEGTYYREQQKGWVQCREYGEEMAAGSMAGHMKTQHGRAAEEIWIWTTSETGEELWTYCMAFPSKGGPWSFLVERCLRRATTRTAVRVHFMHWHVQDTAVILEEGNLPHPRCP